MLFMEESGTFQKVGASDRRMYGPRGLLICGMDKEEQDAVYAMIRNGGIEEIPVIFVDEDMAGKTLKEILALEDGHGQGKASGTHRSIIMSGFSEQELHWFMASYRALKLPRPLWATLTPISENWKISQLLDELAAEDAAYGH
jgi:hypothetical protein